MANAGININGDGSIHDITSMNGKVECVAVARVQEGIYEVYGTLGMVPPPYGWGHVTNPVDRITAQVEVDGQVIRVETRNQADELTDISSMVALHIVIPDREIDVYPLPGPDPEPDAPTYYAQLRAIADEQILMLQDLIDIGESTPEIQTRIIAWKRYRVALSAVPGQPGWPSHVTWPDLVE